MSCRRLILACMTLAAAALAVPRAYCAEASPQPYELMRSLRTVQDRIAAGDTAAYLSYRAALTDHASLLARAGDEVWEDRRNVRAAVAFVLSGGDPHVLEKLLRLSTGQELTLVRAALAYGENRNAEAAELLAQMDPRKLDPSIAGHIALVRSELIARKDPAKALALLADARLLAPGTMIEEAALRRESSLAAEQGDADRFEALSMQYIRRFANSVHMANFRRQFAAAMAMQGMADDVSRQSRMQAALSAFAPDQQQDIYLSVAWDGVKVGKVEVVRWAARISASLTSADSAQQLRARLCEAAVLVVTDDFDKGLSALRSIPTERLDAEEEDLLAAALRVAREVRREPDPFPSTADPPRGASVPGVVATTNAVLARVDDLLSGARK
jgi:chemotaxis protein MotC